jgi:AcrR family transcriptional regulator
MVMHTRRRLSTQERREQLLRVGVELFAGRPYEDVWIEEVATLANVSRGLLYHYFPTKRDFFAAVVQHESDTMLRLTNPDPNLPVHQRLAAGLDAYLDYVQEHVHSFRALQRAVSAGDSVIRATYEANQTEQARRITEAVLANAADLGLDPDHPPATLNLAVRGWLVFVVDVCLRWLDDSGDPDGPVVPRPPVVSKEDMRDLCARALLGALRP